VEGEGTALVFIKDSYFGFDHRPKSTRDIFKISLLVIFTQSYFETLANNVIDVQSYFYVPTVSGAMTYTRITLMFSTLFKAPQEQAK